MTHDMSWWQRWSEQLRQQRRERQRWAAAREELAQRHADLATFAAAGTAAARQLEGDNLHRRLHGPLALGAALRAACRLLVLEGPQSPVWGDLARIHLLGGRGADALRCAAEAVRCGHAEADVLRQVAATLSSAGGQAPALVLDACQAGQLPAERLGTLYEQLRAWPAAAVTRATLWRLVAQQVPDAEEWLRQDERLRRLDVVDEPLLAWLDEGLRPAAAGGPPWHEILPPIWRAALGFDPGALPVGVPPSATPVDWRLPAAAETTALLPAATVQTPVDDWRRQLREQLWPLERRSVDGLTAVLAAVSAARPAWCLAGAELLAAALAEVADPALDPLRRELASLAPAGATALERVRLALAAAAACRAVEQRWPTLRRVADDLPTVERGEGLALCWAARLHAAAPDEPPAWLGELDWSLAAGLEPLLLAQAVAAAGPTSVGRLALARLAATEASSPELAFLLAWCDERWTDVAAATGPALAWAAVALAARESVPGDVLAAVAEEARRAGHVAGWLSAACAADQRLGRAGCPAGTAAWRQICRQRRLEPGVWSALAQTLESPPDGWDEVVSRELLAARAGRRGGTADEVAAEAAATGRLVTQVQAARDRLERDRWLADYRAGVAGWLDAGTG